MSPTHCLVSRRILLQLHRSSASPSVSAQVGDQALTLHGREDGIKIRELVLEDGAGACNLAPSNVADVATFAIGGRTYGLVHF